MPGTARKALVVVPTYNERANIGPLVKRLFDAVGSSADLLVVDDASPDETAEEVKRLATERSDIHLVERARKLGIGSAYTSGFKWALERGYWAVVEMDGDLSHDPACVPHLVAALRDADLAIGSRYIRGGSVENWGRMRRNLSRYANLYARRWLRSDVRDSTAGFRAYRSDALKGIDLASLRSQGYAFQVEMTRRIERAGGRVVEVPITFVERASGSSKMSTRIVAEALFYVAVWGLRDRLASASGATSRAGCGRRGGDR
jgi:dolichol-phosphate mannosyltransferase